MPVTMRIPGPDHEEDGGLRAVAAAGGPHRYPLRPHDTYGPVVRFQPPGKLFTFLDPLCEAGNLRVLPADEHTPWSRLLLSVLAGRPAHERRARRRKTSPWARTRSRMMAHPRA